MQHPKQLLAAYGFDPKKSLGQNFLFDANVLGRIVAAAHIQPADQILEIGPGLGHLTEQLLKTAVPVTAVELDDRFINHLTKQLADYEKFTLIHGDILDIPPDALI